MTGIKPSTIVEGNLKAEKCLGNFGGPNQWDLYVKTVEGYWDRVQWMSVYNIQPFFKTKLPVYKEKQVKEVTYELA
jgi:hypothetical protein